MVIYTSEGSSLLIQRQFSAGLEMNLWIPFEHSGSSWSIWKQFIPRLQWDLLALAGKRKERGRTATSQAASALIAVWSWVNAEGLTATISVNCCSEGGYLTWPLKVISATAIWTKHLAIKLIQAYPLFSWEKCGKNPGREWMASRLMRNYTKREK